MKSKTKDKIVAFLKEAIRAAVAVVAGVAGARRVGTRALPFGRGDLTNRPLVVAAALSKRPYHFPR